MKTYQNTYFDGNWQDPLINHDAQLVLVFGDRSLAADKTIQAQIRDAFAGAEVIGCTTSGEIAGNRIYDGSLCLTAVCFETSRVQVSEASVISQSIESAASQLGEGLEHKGLKYVLVISDGQLVNGTELIKHLQQSLPKNTLISGGLAGDHTRFTETVVWRNDQLATGKVLVCGFYGEQLQIGHGSKGGWDAFGPERLITKSSANNLYQLDGKPALELYKNYLGQYAEDLPASALLFPLLISHDSQQHPVTRTILNIDNDDGTMIFAGDIPQGGKAQLMRANVERLIDGAEEAGEMALCSHKQSSDPGLLLLVSCVGRRLVLDQRVEEELESINELFGDKWACTGFYSYGEISPTGDSNTCALHNQTMTITSITELHA